MVPNVRPSGNVPEMVEVADEEEHDAKICAWCSGSSDASSMRSMHTLTDVRTSWPADVTPMDMPAGITACTIEPGRVRTSITRQYAAGVHGRP